MSFYDGFTPTYTFRLQIERSDRMILDTEITAKGTPDEIAKAKKNVQRLLTEYTPTAKAPEPVPTPAPEANTPALPEPEAQAPAAQQQGKPAETTPPHSAAPTAIKKPEGAKGLLRLYCPECGNSFVTFLREYQTEVACKCGHQIDLTGQLGRYHFTCPYCQHEGWGKTNSEDPEIEVQCKCKEMVTIRWNPDAIEYQN